MQGDTLSRRRIPGTATFDRGASLIPELQNFATFARSLVMHWTLRGKSPGEGTSTKSVGL